MTNDYGDPQGCKHTVPWRRMCVNCISALQAEVKKLTKELSLANQILNIRRIADDANAAASAPLHKDGK